MLGRLRHQRLQPVQPGEGWLYPITENPDVRFELPGDPFSADGRRIIYGSNERSAKDFDAVMRDHRTGETRILMSGDANYFPGSCSPDGRFVVVARLNANTDQDLVLVDTATCESRHLTPHEGEVKFSPGPWTMNGGFYVLTDQGREFTGLAFFNLTRNALEWVETPDWDVAGIDLSRDHRRLAWVVNEDGYSRLFVRELDTGRTRDFPELPRGVIGAFTFSPDGARLALLLARSVRPAELYLLDIESGVARVLSQSFLGGIPEAEMVEPELIRYPTHDCREIPAFRYRPRGAATDSRVPVLSSIHGGPEAQELPGYAYNGLYQYLLNCGIGVLAPNIRGSTGYDKTYQKLIHRDWGGAELRDLEHAVLYLRGLDWVNPERIGVFGGSFGGFAALSCVTRLPDYWAAAVDIVGPSNLITFTCAVPPWWKRLMKEWVGDPDEDAELLRERSPITYVEQARTPLLVIQGANDPRVVKAESDQMVEQLRSLEEPVEYLVFEDEGHGFTKSANTLQALRATTGWLEKYLLA